MAMVETLGVIRYQDTDSLVMESVKGPVVPAHHARRALTDQTRGPYTLVVAREGSGSARGRWAKRRPRLVKSASIVLPVRIVDKLIRSLTPDPKFHAGTVRQMVWDLIPGSPPDALVRSKNCGRKR